MWEITETRDIDRWVVRVCEITPENVLPYASYPDMIEKVKAIGLWYELSVENFIYLQNLYHKEHRNFKVISDMLDRIYCVIVDDWGDMEEPFTPSCLHNIDEVENIMEHNGIPLPSDLSLINI